MGYWRQISLIAAAMLIAADGCATRPPPLAESVVAGTPSPVHSSTSSVVPDAQKPDVSASPNAPGSGASSTTSSPVSTGGAAGDGAASGGAGGVGAPDERRAALDKRLDDSLGAFDARLRKEQQKVAEERDARQATVAATAATSASADGSAKSDPGQSGTGQTEDASGTAGTEVRSPPRSGKSGQRGDARTAHAGDLKSDLSDGINGNPSGNGAPAYGIPDGNDDDIVARRLRKAAQQETDPELKDRLWKEYVEYKNNTQVR